LKADRVAGEGVSGVAESGDEEASDRALRRRGGHDCWASGCLRRGRSLGWAAVWYAGNLRRGPSLDVGIAAGLPEWAKTLCAPRAFGRCRRL
jgi:hypothetical protein